MPELPEVETVRRGLAPVMEGYVFDEIEQNRDNLRFPFPSNFKSKLRGKTVASLDRRAKYLLAHLCNNDVLIMHLGMSGHFKISGIKSSDITKEIDHVSTLHEHIVFYMSGGARIGYFDPRRFGLMDIAGAGELSTHPLLSKLGPEPLGNEFSECHLNNVFQTKRTNIKSALLDQRNVAGLGNIYVNEALYRAGINPGRQAASLAQNTKNGGSLTCLVIDIKDILREAIEAGGSSLKDHARPDGELGYFQHTFSVYGREGKPCLRDGCDGQIKRILQSGRSTFWCPHCQT